VTEKVPDRIMAMNLVTPEKTYNIVSAYVPQQGCEEEEKQQFLSQLEGITTRIPANANQLVKNQRERRG